MSSICRLLDVIPNLVDAQTGVVHECYELPPEADAPAFFHYYARTASTSAFSGQDNFRNTGGVSTQRRVALAKAVGESIERYSSALYSAEELPLVAAKDADFPHLAPEAFKIYADEQFQSPNFPYHPFDESTQVRWTPVIDLTTLETTYAPAATIWMPYYYVPELGENPIIQPISTGLSCHCSLEEALEGALLEVVERDGFSITWQAKLAHPRIRIESLDDALYELVQRIEATGYRVHLLDATNDVGIPVIMTVAFHAHKPQPPLVVAAAAALNPREAIRKSLEEMVHTRRYMREVQDMPGLLEPGENGERVTEQIHHLRFWGDHGRVAEAAFLVSNPLYKEANELTNLDQGNAKANLHVILDQLAALGYPAYAADLTTPDVGSQGLRVVKALVPALHPFYIGHPYRARAHPRLYEVPAKLGFGPLLPGQDNPLPHPFP